MALTPEEVSQLYQKMKSEAEASGYYLNPDAEFAKSLVEGLLVNQERYGYPACPCRLASGNKEADLDIICPCDYRDADVTEYGACYCALYVSQSSARGQREVTAIPERQLPPEKRTVPRPSSADGIPGSLSLPVWRCRVCGYLCARDAPPDICPICKAKKERFVKFI